MMISCRVCIVHTTLQIIDKNDDEEVFGYKKKHSFDILPKSTLTSNLFLKIKFIETQYGVPYVVALL